MFFKNTSPNLLLTLTGYLEFGDTYPSWDRQSIAEDESKNQAFGNKCGHLKLYPRIYVAPDHHKRRFPILEDAKDRLKESYFYPLKYGIAPLFYHQDKARKDGSKRLIRSERRESITTRFGVCLLHVLNLGKMSAGYFDKKTKKFVYYNYYYFMREIGCSRKQLERAIAIYESRGYIEIISDKENLRYVGNKAIGHIIKVSKQFLLDLGIILDDINKKIKAVGKKNNKDEKKLERIEENPISWRDELFIINSNRSNQCKKSIDLIEKVLIKKPPPT